MSSEKARVPKVRCEDMTHYLHRYNFNLVTHFQGNNLITWNQWTLLVFRSRGYHSFIEANCICKSNMKFVPRWKKNPTSAHKWHPSMANWLISSVSHFSRNSRVTRGKWLVRLQTCTSSIAGKRLLAGVFVVSVVSYAVLSYYYFQLFSVMPFQNTNCMHFEE